MGFLKKVAKTVSKAASQVGAEAQRAVVNSVALPTELAAKTAGSVVQSAGGLLQVVQQNPAVAQLAAGAAGIPLPGGLFGGSPTPTSGGASSDAYTPRYTPPENNQRLLIIGGIVAVVGIAAVLLMRKK